MHTGGQIVIKPTKTQSGGFLGTLLASIGVPLLLNALTGKGLQVDNKRLRRSVNVHVPKINKNTKDGGLVYRSPPFIGTWDNPMGMGVKPKIGHQKKDSQKGQRSAPREKQSVQRNPDTWNNTIKFINKPLSNIDLLNWVKKLGIKHFRGVYSRDGLPDRMKNKECGIINLDSQIGPGTHWVAYRNVESTYCEYFDSFGLLMPNEVMKYFTTSGKRIFYSGDEIQERDSVLCGYWCLYYLLERQRGVPMLGVIHNAKFDMNDQTVNHRFIIDYFKNI